MCLTGICIVLEDVSLQDVSLSKVYRSEKVSFWKNYHSDASIALRRMSFCRVYFFGRCATSEGVTLEDASDDKIIFSLEMYCSLRRFVLRDGVLFSATLHSPR